MRYQPRSIAQRIRAWRNRPKTIQATTGRPRRSPSAALTFERLDPRQLMAIDTLEIDLAMDNGLTSSNDAISALSSTVPTSPNTEFVGPVAASQNRPTLGPAASPTADAGFAYALTSSGHLFRVDTQSGQSTPLFETGLEQVESLSFGPNRQLWAVAGRNQLYRLDLEHQTTHGLSTSGSSSWPAWIESLAFDGQTMYATASYQPQKPTADTLIKIDLATGSAEAIGNMGPAGTDVEGLTFGRDGNLYGSNIVDNQWVQIDRQTGRATARQAWDSFVTGMDLDAQGRMWGVVGHQRGFGQATLMQVEPSTGRLTPQATLPVSNIMGLAMPPAMVDPGIGNLPSNPIESMDDTGGGDEPSGGNGGGDPGGGGGGSNPEDPVSATVWVSNAAGYEGELLKFRVELQGSPEAGPNSVGVSYQFQDQTAVRGSDFTPEDNSVQLSWSNPIGYILVQANTDLQEEQEEQFFVSVTASNGVAVRYANPDENGKAVGSISDSGSETVELSLDDVQLEEGTQGMMRASLSRPAPHTIAVQYQSQDDSATVDDGDYQSLSGTIHFAKGETVKYIAVNSLVNSDLTAAERYRIQATITDEGSAQTKSAKVTIVETDGATIVDLDIDSNNNGALDSDEDAIENDPNLVGKWIPINNGDANGNQIVDWADWNSNNAMVPARLSLSGQYDLETAKVFFDYQGSDPQSVTQSEGIYSRAPGRLRIWADSGSEDRNPSSLADGGDFISPGWHSLSDLGFTAAVRVVDFFIEGLQLSTAIGTELIRVTLDPGASGPAGSPNDQLQDEVRGSIAAVDADVDTLNNDFNGSAEVADQREYRLDLPGAVVLANRLDRNNDGVPGFADGIDRWGNEGQQQNARFAKFRVAIPLWVDPEVARLSFQYQAADPDLTTRTASSPTAWEYAPGSGKPIRLWQRDGIYTREVADLSSGGNFINAKNYQASLLDWYDESQWQYAEIYIEGINETQAAGVRINVRLDPDGEGSAGWVMEDQVRLSVSELKIVSTDVSGITGPAAEKLTRIHRDREPDGLTADWQPDVSDGSTLLLRVVVPDYLHRLVRGSNGQSATHSLDIAFGQFDTTSEQGAYTELDSENGFWFSPDESVRFADGLFANGHDALRALDIDAIDDIYKNQDRRVLAATFYQPPWEAALGPNDLIKSRNIQFAVKAEGIFDEQGGEPGDRVTIARPPIITVHGISSSASVWDNLKAFLDRDYAGHHAIDFSVNHFDEQKGSGELSLLWERVADMTQRASHAFRSGESDTQILFADENNEPLMIAHQKSIIVAHSYGGLLSRWYLEQAEDPQAPGERLFDNRRDVMRLITLGTPHKGAPITNIITEALKGGLLGQTPVKDLERYLHFVNFEEAIELLQDPTSFAYYLIGPVYSFDPDTGKPYPAIEAMTIGSQILKRLNADPFHDDVSYAAIAGTNIRFNLYEIMQPYSFRPDTGAKYSWFPWLNRALPGQGDNDTVVPTWSATLGVPEFNAFVGADHSQLPSEPRTYELVDRWISGRDANGQPNRVPLGREQRLVYEREAPLSVRNMLDGSQFSEETNTNTGGGLNRDAFSKIEFDPTDDSDRYGVFPLEIGGTPYRLGTLPNEAGVKSLTLTGMIQWKDRHSVRLKVVADGRTSVVLHDLGVLALSDLNIPAAATIGVQDNDWVPFRVTKATIGRDNLNNVIGPHGSIKASSAPISIRYHLQTASQRTAQLSREVQFTAPLFSLGAPFYHAATQKLRLNGTVRAVNIGQGSQNSMISLQHDVGGRAVTLLTVPVTIDHPPGVFSNVLLPYSVEVSVTFDANNRIILNGVNTKLTSIQIYQQVLEPNGWFQPKSKSILLKK